ncbi:MAG: ABC transporter substrate-binding protein [Proteobacteria bacterium]|nr:ABC transporter substrate-binding protein [Pseudomonadota bacterium]MBU1688925.1 ABC transporter substrate-binding protein [Pseudomonadota bacterium]
MRLLKLKSRLLLVFLALTLVVSWDSSLGVCAEDPGPMVQIRETVDSILLLMRDPALASPEKSGERRTRIIKAVDIRFDFREMSMRTLGKVWDEKSEEQRGVFQKLFADLLKNNYIGRIEGYSNEEISYHKVIMDKTGSRAMVFTSVIKNTREISINYKLILKGHDWRVYDVEIEGVSLVKNYRSEFSRIISKEDYAGLIKRMEEKVRLE